ncbi:MAG: SpoIIE family protein phosphatase [Chlorobi bacterium]|nr:SpoIIE family protein phosphatase [Chlorobiota bacterium]
MRRIRKSLFFKLALLIVISSGTVLAIVMIVSNYNLRTRILEEQKKYYTSLAAKSAIEIDQKLFKAKTIVDKAAIIFKVTNPTREKSIQLLKNILNSDEMIGGSAVALAPETQFDKAGFQMLYAWKDNDTIKYADRINPEQDYKSEWFIKPYTLKKDIWTEPYIDTDVNRMMVTYSTPVIVNGNVTAIITCDLILDSVEKLLMEVELGHQGAPVLVTNEGRIISYPKKEWVLKETIASIGKKLPDPADREMMKNLSQLLRKKQSGNMRLKQINSSSFMWFYFDTVKEADWRIGFLIPEKAILSPINDLNKKMLIIALLGITALLIPAFFVSHSITNPLKALCDASDSLANGNFDAPLPKLKSNDEIGRLVMDFERMRIDLQDYIKTLAATTAEKEKIASELSVAKEIQHSILPKLFPPYPKYSGLDIFASLDSAKEVGGDLYDFALLDDKKLYICIGDVSGKGVPASLFMAVGKTLLKSTVQNVKDPAKALYIVNNELSENNDASMFITLFCGILNLKTNELTYANAGHNPPIIVTGKKSFFIKQASAPPLGAMPDIKFTNETIKLPEDSLFLLYTDGVTEAMNSENKLFGDNTLLEVIKNNPAHTAEKCIVNIKNAVNHFVGNAEQSDDITMLCLSNNINNNNTLHDKNTPDASIVFTNNKSEYPRIESWLNQTGEKLNWQPGFLMQLNLALEEWIVNVISYAFTDNDIHEIEVRLWQTNKSVRIEISDDGIPFNPLEEKHTDTDSPAEEREIGGLGIHFIKNTVDVFSYKRVKNRNVVIMEKSL